MCKSMEWFRKTNDFEIFRSRWGGLQRDIFVPTWRFYALGSHDWTSKILVLGVRGSVRSGSGLSPEGCNFSRFLESGFQWPNIFQLLYYDVVREDFTKKITWSPVLSFFTDALHHLAMYRPMLDWVNVETLSKVSNNHSGFSCVTLTKKYDVVLNWMCAV